jgi:hypothetical protein
LFYLPSIETLQQPSKDFLLMKNNHGFRQDRHDPDARREIHDARGLVIAKVCGFCMRGGEHSKL